MYFSNLQYMPLRVCVCFYVCQNALVLSLSNMLILGGFSLSVRVIPPPTATKQIIIYTRTNNISPFGDSMPLYQGHQWHATNVRRPMLLHVLFSISSMARHYQKCVCVCVYVCKQSQNVRWRISEVSTEQIHAWAIIVCIIVNKWSEDA